MPARKSSPKPSKPKTKPTAAPHGPSEGQDKPARRKAKATPAKKAPAKKSAPARKPRGAAASKASKPASKAKPANPPAASVAAQLLARKGAPDAPQQERPLTNLEEAFITEYMRNGQNGTAAWLFVHPGTSPGYASLASHRAIRKDKVKARIEAERKRLAKRHELTREDLVDEWLAIARADPNELTQMRSVACSHCWGGNPGKGRWIDPDPDCENCRGEGNSVPWVADTRKLSHEARALFAGIQQTKEGVKVLMHDQANARVQASKILGMYEKDNEQKGRGAAEAIKEFFSAVQGARLPIVKPGIVKP